MIRVWLTAPEETTIARLATRTSRKVPVSDDEARATYAKATARAATEIWDLVLDLSGMQDPEGVVRAFRAVM